MKKRCEECGGEIRPTKNLFQQSPDYADFKKELEKMGISETKGYNCIDCGQAYDENLKKMNMRLGWLLK